MQKLTTKPATPRSLAAGRGSGHSTTSDANAQNDFSTDCAALAVYKRNKLCTVAKITCFNSSNELILAIVHRHQTGTQTMISVPAVALNYAEAHNVTMLYYRNDKQATMRCISLSDLKKKAYLKLSDKVLEYFIRIADMQPSVWREWLFAKKTIVLTSKQDDAKQLALF